MNAHDRGDTLQLAIDYLSRLQADRIDRGQLPDRPDYSFLCHMAKGDGHAFSETVLQEAFRRMMQARALLDRRKPSS